LFSGRVANKGRATGLVRKIETYKDLDAVCEGDVLVAVQTDMNYTPYLQDCVGLITQSGGRYSHAAIYARENDLPCIVGVKEAMTLDDGRKIILDANKNEICYDSPN